jgi:hypothetical protein
MPSAPASAVASTVIVSFLFMAFMTYFLYVKLQGGECRDPCELFASPVLDIDSRRNCLSCIKKCHHAFA